jgi:hypothetical protein
MFVLARQSSSAKNVKIVLFSSHGPDDDGNDSRVTASPGERG